MVDPEAVAAEVLAAVPSYLWDGWTLPVPVEEIVDSVYGLQVVEADDLHAVAGVAADTVLSGLLLVPDKQILVSRDEAAEWPGRRRFTIGHELGHWCLHRDDQVKVFCRSPAPDEAAGADREQEASEFAGALLFPDALVRATWDGDFDAMVERFGASKAATRRALFRVVHEPAVRERSLQPEGFFYDDPSYETFRALHREEGFLVNDHLLDPRQAKVHRLSCSYLDRAVSGQPRTAQPKWASLDLDELRGTFPQAAPCGRCKPF